MVVIISITVLQTVFFQNGQKEPADTVRPVESCLVTVYDKNQVPTRYALPLANGERVSDAIAKIHGLTLIPEKSKVTVKRHEPGKDILVLMVDWHHVGRGTNNTTNYLLKGGDHIEIWCIQKTIEPPKCLGSPMPWWERLWHGGR